MPYSQPTCPNYMCKEGTDRQLKNKRKPQASWKLEFIEK